MKKLNIGIIAVLLVFQTFLSPISALANEVDGLSSKIDTSSTASLATEEGQSSESEQTGETETGNVDPVGEGESGDEGDEPLEEVNPPIAPDENNDSSETELEEGEKTDGALTSDSEVKSEDGNLIPLSAEPEEIRANLASFKMTIDGEEVHAGYDKELAQGTIANFEVTFDVTLDNLYTAGSWFEFQLPNSLIDYDAAFKGNEGPNPGVNPAYSYSTTGNIVRVELSQDLTEDYVSDTEPVKFTMFFKSGFSNLSDEFEQELEIPTAGGGKETIKLTFLPSTSNEKTSKSAIGTPAIVNGNHQMEWEVWVNKAGKDLIGATLQDNPGSKHAIVEDSILVEQYAVKLNGVDTSSVLQSTYSNNFPINFEDGRYAYRVRYKTEVLLDAESREGSQSFSNSVTFTNGSTTEEASATQTVTYGKAIDKFLNKGETNTNYQSHWEIRYNYNQIEIPKDKAWIEDTLDLPHEIDFTSIKVYEVNVNETGVETSSTEITTGFTITPDSEHNKFILSFDDTITKAYKIKYKGTYNEKEFYTDPEKQIYNKVESGSGKKAQDPHTLREGILSKSRTIDFDKKEIEWSIKITADNGDITNLKLDDTFAYGTKTGKHTLIGGVSGINISGITGTPTITLKDSDLGFEITGINIPEGSTATIVYKTKFDIGSDGSVAENGYGNSAVATWIDAKNKEHSLTKYAHYTPETTTKNNGSKSGSFNYLTQEFTWGIKVNINKTNINGAILTDELGPGHEIVADSIKVYEYHLIEDGTDHGDDTKGTKGNELTTGYTITSITDKSFTLTFNGLTGGAENKAYFVEYQTKDSNDILGIESDNENELGNVYSNDATFTTQGKSYDLGSAKVTVNNANKLIGKSVSGNSANNSTDILNWTIDINLSRSSLGQIILTDTPSESLILDPTTIEYREETNVNKDSGAISYSGWKKPTEEMLTTTDDGGYKLVLPYDQSNPNKAYQIRYATLALAEQGKPFSNNAIIEFGFNTSNNQKNEDQFNGLFAFSMSDSSFSLTKGSVKFQKVGYDPSTGKTESLSNVQFELIKTIGKGTNANDFVIAKATSSENGLFEFNNINYGTYRIKEINQPEGYILMDDVTFVLKADNDTLLEGNKDRVIEIENVKAVDETKMCPQFTLTIRDVDGELVKNKEVTLKVGDNIKYTFTTNNDGKLELSRTGNNSVKAATYSVYADNELLGDVTVKYIDGCEAELQPVNTCPVFTITLKDDNGDLRKGVTVTLKAKDGTEVAKATTDSEGKITIPPTTKAGKYDLYEGKQFLSEVNVTYKGGCSTEVTQAPSCPVFTLTVKDVNGKVLEAGVAITIQNVDTDEIFNGTTDTEGKVIFATLKPGKYIVYEGSNAGDVTKRMGEFAVDTTCEAVVQPAPACPAFTITVKGQDGKVRPNVKITVKDSDGNIVVKDIVTNGNGEISLSTATLKSGNYNIFENELFLSSITVDYKVNCNAELSQAPTCPIFTLTVQNVDGVPRKDVKVEIKDYMDNIVGNSIEIATTDENGQIKVQPNQLKPGKYIVYELNVEGNIIATLGIITVDNTCSALVKPIPTGGGGGTTPPTNPGNEDPNKPGETPKDPEGEKPKDPNGEEPKDPNGKDPKDPNGENPKDPDGEEPKDPDGEEPKDPDGEEPNDPDNGNPTNPEAGNPTGSKGDDSTNSGNDSDANTKDNNQSPSKNSGTDTNNGKNNPEKLPQTDGESQFIFVLLGIFLVLTSGWLLLRRKQNAI